MGCQYGVTGTMTLRYSDEVIEKIKALEEDLGEIGLETEIKGDLLGLSISGMSSMSYSTAMEIDKRLESFANEVTEAACFETECDGEHGCVWVGPEHMVKKAQRENLINEAAGILQQLSLDEINEALRRARDKAAAPPVASSADALQVLTDLAIKKGFSSFPDCIEPHLDNDFQVSTETDVYTLTIEEDEDDPIDMTTSASVAGCASPKELKDHTSVLDAALAGLGSDPAVAAEITALTTDGDNHDCEAKFNFRGKAWTIKVR